jgi:hypothetical protein
MISFVSVNSLDASSPLVFSHLIQTIEQQPDLIFFDEALPYFRWHEVLESEFLD